MAESAFMLRQRKLLEETKKNKGVPPLKSIYGPATPTTNTDNGLQNITGPGGQEFFDATNEVKDAYKEGGFSSAAGIALRKTPGVLAATVRDTVTPKPLRNLVENIAGESKEIAQAAVTGKAVPTPIQNTAVDRGDNTKMSAAQLSTLPQETSVSNNWMRNESTGEVFAIDSAGRINGGDLPSKTEGRMGGYNLDGSRIVPSGKQGDQGALRASNAYEKRLEQYDYQEGLKSGRYKAKRDPLLGMGEAERIAYRKTKVNEEKNLRDYETTTESNKILQENNNLQGMVKLKRESKVLNDYGPAGEITGQRIVQQDAHGNWPDQQTEQDSPEISFLRNDPSEYNKKMFKKKYGYLPAWAMNK